MRGAFGSLEWAARTGGHVSGAEALAQAVQGIGAALANRAGAASAALGLGRRAKLALREVDVPRTTLTEVADALCRASSAPWLYQHCLRTYVWAALLAARDGIAFDGEILSLACLFHDLGVTEPYAAAPGECFAIRGARAAEEILRDHPVGLERRKAVADAIALHLNVAVGSRFPVEARLLRQGTGFDVVGQRAHALSREQIAAVLRAHPRLGFKRELDAVVTNQSRQSPRSRIALLCRHLGFRARIRAAPFPE